MFSIHLQNGERISIERQISFAGRDPSCDIVVDDKGVSRRHACFVDLGHKVVLLDFKSANGTLLNSTQVEQVDLRPGDVVQVGSTSFTVEVPQPVSDRFRISAVGYKPYLTTEELDEAQRRGYQYLATADGRRTLEMLGPLVTDLSARDDSVTQCKSALRVASDITGLDRGMIMLVGEDRTRLERAAMIGFEPDYFLRRNLHYVLIEEAMENRRVVQTKDLYLESVFARSTLVLPNVCSSMAVPLVYLGTSIGVLYADRRIATGAFGDRDMLAMAFIAYQLSVSLGNGRILMPPPSAADLVRVLDLALLEGFAHCEVCGLSIEPGGKYPIVLCDRCETPHHQDCWQYNNRCAIYGCMHAFCRPHRP